MSITKVATVTSHCINSLVTYPIIKFVLIALVLSLSTCQFVDGLPNVHPQQNGPDQRNPNTFDLIILHNNDMHARFEETGLHSDKCQPNDAAQGKCYGGFARVAHIVQKYRNESTKGGPPVLYLNAGDTFTGTPWFKIYEEQIVIDFMNALKPDAVSLGNHEFDLKLESLATYLNGSNYPVVTCNLDLSRAPEIATTKSLKNYTILTVNGIQIGIVGYLTPDTKFLAQTSTVDFRNEIPSINQQTKELKAKGVKIIIALGHSGFEADKLIARNCPDVDVVVGGHTNTFLYNGRQPSVEEIQGPYPVVISQKSGKKVPVVQAFAYTKYMGILELTFDTNGNLRTFSGQPIILDSKIPQDPAIVKLLEKYRPGVESLLQRVIGKSAVFLDGDCRFKECNFGNLVTDAMVYVNELTYIDENRWTDASIAFIQGGGIRSSVSKGNITAYDMALAFPFDETYIVKVNLTGAEILKVLEHSVHRYSDIDGRGEFLQMSGIHVVYNLSAPSLARVESVEVLCSDCPVPKMQPLNASKLYTVLINSFLQTGGDGYDAFNKNDVISLNRTDSDVIQQYIHAMEVVYPAIDSRIILYGRADDGTGDDGGGGEGDGASQIVVSIGLIALSIFINL